MNSRLFRLSLPDWGKGLIVAVLTTPVTIIFESASKGQLVFDEKAILAGAIAGGAAYVIKNFLTGPSGKLLNGGPR